MKEVVRLPKLRVKIIQWADDKGILEKATPEKQFLKFMEETGELAKAILNQDSEEFIDAIGDVFVTIVIHAELKGIDFSFNIYEPEFMDDEFAIMVESINESHYARGIFDLYSIWFFNKELAIGKSFSDCVESAYNVISDRNGEMINGTFVKDK